VYFAVYGATICMANKRFSKRNIYEVTLEFGIKHSLKRSYCFHLNGLFSSVLGHKPKLIRASVKSCDARYTFPNAGYTPTGSGLAVERLETGTLDRRVADEADGEHGTERRDRKWNGGAADRLTSAAADALAVVDGDVVVLADVGRFQIEMSERQRHSLV